MRIFNISMTIHHKDKAAKSARKLFYLEIDLALITHLQSSKLQAKAYRWNDEETKARL